MTSKRVSIIIPTYNRGHLIADTLESIIAQSYKNWECIVVDDGSIDSTEEIVKLFVKGDSRFQYLSRPNHLKKGANSCRNYGFEISKGEYIQWFDSDDLMHPNLLQRQLQSIKESSKNISICNFCFFRKVEEIHTKEGFNQFEPSFNANLFSRFVSGKIVLNMQTALIKRKGLSSIKFNEDLVRAQDLDFMFKVLLVNKNSYVICDKNLAYVRRHDESITEKFMNRDLTAIFSEISVRESIWRVLRDEKFKKSITEGGMLMYFKALKYLLYTKQAPLILLRFFKSMVKVDFKGLLLIIKLVVLSVCYIIAKKGVSAYQRLLNNY